jgi:hypothetical protein
VGQEDNVKKIVVIATVLALVAGAAFAQDISVSGRTFTAVDLMAGNNDDGSKVMSGNAWAHPRIEASGSTDTDVGAFGAWVRLEPGEFQGYSWWQPVEVFKLTMGRFSDSWWGQGGNMRWGFYGVNGDILGHGFTYASDTILGAWTDAIKEEVGAENFHGLNLTSQAWYGGLGNGLLMDITPNDMVTVRVGLPFAGMKDGVGNDSRELGDVFAEVNLQLALALDFGKIAVSYAGSAADNNNGNVYAYLGMPITDDIKLDVGLGFHLLDDAQIGVGAGVVAALTNEFELRVRLNALLDTATDSDFGFSAEVVPSYAITPNVRAGLGIGFAAGIPSDSNMDTETTFYLFPHVRVNTSGPSFHAGFELMSSSLGSDIDNRMTWRLPVGLSVSF